MRALSYQAYLRRRFERQRFEDELRSLRQQQAALTELRAEAVRAFLDGRIEPPALEVLPVGPSTRH